MTGTYGSIDDRDVEMYIARQGNLTVLLIIAVLKPSGFLVGPKMQVLPTA
jgi:hypothetical protein